MNARPHRDHRDSKACIREPGPNRPCSGCTHCGVIFPLRVGETQTSPTGSGQSRVLTLPYSNRSHVQTESPDEPPQRPHWSGLENEHHEKTLCHAGHGRRSSISRGISVEPANRIRQASIMADDQTGLIGADLCRSGLPVLGAGCQGFRQHDGNREHELRALAVYSSASTGRNNLDLWILDRTQLRCRSKRAGRVEGRYGSGTGRGPEDMRSAPVASIGRRRVDRLSRPQ